MIITVTHANKHKTDCRSHKSICLQIEYDIMTVIVIVKQQKIMWNKLNTKKSNQICDSFTLETLSSN